MPSNDVAEFLRIVRERAPYDSGLAAFVAEARAFEVEPDGHGVPPVPPRSARHGQQGTVGRIPS